MQSNEDEKFKHTLKKALTEDPDGHFLDALEQRLLAKAPNYLGKKSVFNPLSMFFRFSKRFSPALVASFLIIAITGGVLFQMNQNGPQEILNKAYAYYDAESQKDGIYYEKNSYASVMDNGMETYITEVWHDNLGNYLSIQKDPITAEIEAVSLIKINENGQAKFYDDLPQEESPNTQPFLEENFYCVEFYENGGMKHNTTLMISAKDREYTISGWSEEKNPEITEQEKFETMMNELESGKSSPERTKSILQTIKKTKNLQDKKISEKGKSYHVFTMDMNTDVQIHYYINSETYRLEKMTETLKATQETIFSMEYLESEYLDHREAENIFNPGKYGLHPSQMLEAGNPSNLTENGCYKTNGDKMTAEEEKEFWSTLPPSAKNDMEDFKQDTIETTSNLMNSTPLTLADSTNYLNLNLMSPLKGGVTQGFTNTHAAVDFASMLVEESVVAADDGIVSSVSNDNSWNGGYQNTVTIDHENGLQTFYARLGAVDVEKGDTVKKGDVIAKVDKENGYIHFELRLDGKPINPIKQGLE